MPGTIPAYEGRLEAHKTVLKTSCEKILVVAALLAVFTGSSVSADSKEWKTGDSKFGGSLKLDYSYNVNGTTADSKATIKPTLAAILFNRTFNILGGTFQLGNYGSYSISPPSIDVNNMKKWSVYLTANVFGVTVWTKTKNINTSSDFNDVALGISPAGRNSAPNITFYAGPVPISIKYGVDYSLQAKPAFSINPNAFNANGVNSVTANAAFIPVAAASAFLEGSASLVVVKGGVGAALNLFSGQGGPKLDASLSVTLANYVPTAYNYTASVKAFLTVTALSGRLYAFVDRISIRCCFKKKWKRILDITIATWNGITWNVPDTVLWSKTGAGGTTTAATTQPGGTGSSTQNDAPVDIDLTAETTETQTSACGNVTGEAKLNTYNYYSGTSTYTGCYSGGGGGGGPGMLKEQIP